MMKRILSIVALCLIITGCPGKPNIPMYCEYLSYEPCFDGLLPEFCMSYDYYSACGFEVNGRWYECDFCDYDLMGCERAMEVAFDACYYGGGGMLMEKDM